MPTYYYPDYCNVKKSARHNFMFYANFELGPMLTKPNKDLPVLFVHHLRPGFLRAKEGPPEGTLKENDVS